MTTIYYDSRPGLLPTWRNRMAYLTYDAAWEQRASAFPAFVHHAPACRKQGPEQVRPWLANLLPENLEA